MAGARDTVTFVAWLRGPLSHSSSWAPRFGYCLVKEHRKPALAIQFVDKRGRVVFSAWYPGTDITDYERMRRARSKGKAVHKYWFTNDYSELVF